MDRLDERLARLERQVRVYRVVTAAIGVVLLVFFGWVGFNVWKNLGLQQRISPRIGVAPTSATLLTATRPVGTSLFTAANDTHPVVSLKAKEDGWALQLHDENGLVGANDEMSVVFGVSSDSRPSLSLIGKDGKEVWRAP